MTVDGIRFVPCTVVNNGARTPSVVPREFHFSQITAIYVYVFTKIVLRLIFGRIVVKDTFEHDNDRLIIVANNVGTV